MKNSFLIFILFIFLLTVGCGRKGPSKPDETETFLMQPVDTLPFTNIIRIALDKAILSLETFYQSEDYIPLIFRIFFYEKDKKHYFYICREDTYYRDWATAYFEYGGYMFIWEKNPGAIENIDPYIDVSKITPYLDTVPGFTDFSNSIMFIESYGFLYEIVTPDSLVLVREGYW